DWLLNQPAFLAQNWPYDTALLYGADWQDNAPIKEAIVANVQEFARRFTFPRIVAGRAEDFFRDVERRYGTKIPVRRGDTGLYWEDGAASTAAELAAFRSAQLAARASEIVAVWDDRIEPRDDDAPQRRRSAAAARDHLSDGLLRLGQATRPGRGRLVFNAGSWERTDVARVAGGAGKSLTNDGRELASVDLEDGDALVLFREVPPLGYLALAD